MPFEARVRAPREKVVKRAVDDVRRRQTRARVGLATRARERRAETRAVFLPVVSSSRHVSSRADGRVRTRDDATGDARGGERGTRARGRWRGTRARGRGDGNGRRRAGNRRRDRGRRARATTDAGVRRRRCVRSSADADRGFSGWMGSSLSRDRWNESAVVGKSARARERAANASRRRRRGRER